MKKPRYTGLVMERMLSLSVGCTKSLWGVVVTRHGRGRFEVSTIDGRNTKDLMEATIDLLKHPECWLKTNWGE